MSIITGIYHYNKDMTKRELPFEYVGLTPSSCNNSAIRRATRRMGQIYDEAMAPCGLKATQYSLLLQIERGQGATMRQLAENLIMDLSALGHTLKPLLRDGHVKVEADETDRRSRRVYLTAQGKSKLVEGHPMWKKMHGAFDRVLGKEDANLLRKRLDVIASPDFANQVAEAMRNG
jgi:DNA-binding MarR family transcriptional regulator